MLRAEALECLLFAVGFDYGDVELKWLASQAGAMS